MTARDHAHFRDQVRYSTEEVEANLPAVWDDEFVLSARPPKAKDNGLRSKPDPRQIPDWLLAAADVQVAFRRAGLTHEEKVCLEHVHHLGFTPGALSQHWVGTSAEQIHAACLSGIQRMADHLNGRTSA